MLGFLKKIFEGHPLAEFELTVGEINALEPEIQKLSDAELKAESLKLKARVLGGEEERYVIPRAFALVREAAKRTLGQRPYDVQLIGGLALHKGAVTEMMTGEGKTLSAVGPAYLNALYGNGAHLVTVNEYLARRDAVWMGQVYKALGLTVSCLVPNAAYIYDPVYHAPTIEQENQRESASNPRESALLDKERDTTGSFLVQSEFLRPASRREAYLADITYGTNHEFGFDYLRDNLVYRLTDQVQREHAFAIIDEVDSILIDEARTPLIISAPDVESSKHYKTFSRLVQNLELEKDYLVDEKLRSATITEEGITKVENMLGVGNLYSPENLRLVHYLEESLKAKSLFSKDKEYVVKNGQIVIVDEFTGRMLFGRRYNGGLHQAIEAKEGLNVQEESKTYGKISIQNYFRMYKKISGMTGTAQTSAEEFAKVYSLEVVSIPPNRPVQRNDVSDVVYKTAAAKWISVVEDIKARHEKGQPVLVGTTSIAKNELLDSLLSEAHVPHEVLNAKNNEREGAIIAQAGRAGAITVATNMAGRGVDIILGGNPPDQKEAEKVKELGGLHVVGTERHEARRIDNQLRGRAGRQGDPGSSQFFLSMEDDLMRIFGGDRIKSMMDRFNLPDDEPIDMPIISRAVREAQSKVEGANFDMRKHLLEYDDVLNKQRGAVYKRRQMILQSFEPEKIAELIFEATNGYLGKIYPEAHADMEAGNEDPGKPNLKKVFAEMAVTNKENPYPEEETLEALESLLKKRSDEMSRHPMAPNQVLGILDLLWMTHLEDLEALSESIGLRAYAQRDPLVEYRQEAHKLFQGFWDNYGAWIFMNIFKLPPAGETRQAQPQPRVIPQNNQNISGNKVGRNDPCPCGAKHTDGRPMKYKHCHGKNA
ncbi:MAG: preprotein translocase subunit SecA [Candidatus Liptonbacteria bacterium]|nr:preprotein translocase subunit SecA [Candidatus Liptonbacteria bacterium]